MENEKIRVNVTSDREGVSRVLLGNDLIELSDESSIRYQADNLESFAKYINPFEAHEGDVCDPTHALFATSTGVTCIETDVEYNTEVLAQCSLTKTDRYKTVTGMLNSDITPIQAERFLRPNKDLLDTCGRDVLSRVEKLSVSRVENIVREKGRDGSMEISYSRKGGGREEADIPERFKITLPLYKYHTETVSLDVEVFFDYTTIEGAVVLKWRFDCYNIDELVEQVSREMFRTHLGDLKMPLFFGSAQVLKKTNEWKYSQNKLPR